MDPTTVTTDVIIAAIAGSLIFNEVKSDIKKYAKDYIKSLVKKKKEEKKIRDGLQKLKDRERKRLETAALEEEYDFEGLWEYLKTHVRSEYEKTIHYDIEKKRDALDDLFRNARKAANCGNNTEATEAVDEFLRSIIEYLRNTDWEKLSHDQRYLATVVIGGVDSIITKKTNDLAGHLNETIAQSAEDIKQSVAQDISQIAAGESPKCRFINIPAEEVNFSIPNDLKAEGKDTITGLTRAQKTSWIVGDHGMGKTTYMRYLISAERGNPAPRFKTVIWVRYIKNLQSSIQSTLESEDLDIEDINKENCLVFIDNADEKIRNELKDSKYSSIVSVCSFDGNPTVSLGKDLGLAKKIFKAELGKYWKDPEDPAFARIIKRTGGHPYVASLLGIQVKRHLDENKPLSQYEDRLKKEGFQIKTDNNTKSVADATAGRYEADYKALDKEEQDILKCFCTLEGSDFYVYPEKIRWKADKLALFAGLRKKGFLEGDNENGYYMHEIMRAAVKKLCGKINYEDVQELVKALAEYIRRDSLYGRDIISVYEEVMQAFALFSTMSGKEFWKKKEIESFESEEDYAWMTHNLFSAFDDYKIDLAHEGSKYAAKLCELSVRKGQLSEFQLAMSYNSVGFLPTAYDKIGLKPGERIELIAENFSYLKKAADIIQSLKEKGELHEGLEAKIISNTAAVWQRVFRMFNTANRAREEYNDILADTMSLQKKNYRAAYDIRRKLYEEYGPEDEEKQLRRKDYIKANFNLATACYFSHDYRGAIKLHEEAINGFVQLENSGVKVDSELFTSYSRYANTKFSLAQEEGILSELQEACYYFCKAYEYLNRLARTAREKQEIKKKQEFYYRDYLKACIDLKNQSPSYRMSVNGKDMSIDDIMNELRDNLIKLIDEASLAEPAKDAKKIKINNYFTEGKPKGHYQ